MAKPETTFTASVHRHLPPLSQLYREKMANPYRGGTADYWYSGVLDLWVEWKFHEPPKRDDTIIDLTTKGDVISPIQRIWLRDRADQGRNVWVIVGCKAGGVVFRNKTWETAISAGTFRKNLLTRQAVAQQINHFLQGH